MGKIDIETLKKELEKTQVILTLDSDNTINNILSPIECSIKFSNITVDIIHPASVYLSGDAGHARLSQINYVHKQDYYGKTRYVVNCGKVAQTNKDYILQCL